MAWTDAIAKHEHSLNLTSYKAEDMIARRVMRGIGYPATRLGDLERALGLFAADDATNWERTEAVLRGMLIRSGKNWVLGPDRQFPGLFRLTTMDCDKNRKAVLNLASIFTAHTEPPLPLYFSRITGTEVCKAYFLAGHELMDSIRWLTPPFTVIGEYGQWWLVEQDLEKFVAQFGPYSFGPEAG